MKDEVALGREGIRTRAGRPTSEF
jgi:hypothetical protein